jgi:hypothetical protein
MKKSITFLVLQISLALVLMSTSALAQNQYIFEFDGVDDLIRYNDDATLDVMNGATDYTIQCWVYPTSTTIHNKVVLRRWNQFVITLYQDANRRFYFTHKDNSGANTFVNSDTNVVNIGEWNHLAVVCNSSENRVYLYVNGVDVTLTPQTALTLRDDTADDNFYVGYGGTGTYPACFIDEVYVSNVATPQSELRFNTDDLPFMPDANAAVLFHFDEGTGDSTLNSASGIMARLGGVDPGDPQQPTWRTWDYPPTSLPLPVELTFFTANVNGSTVSLNWTTATEINNRGFEIQRKSENANWENIGFVPGFGTTTESRSYNYLDNSVSNGKYFYRLKQIDFNGTFSYSSIVEANVETPIEFALNQNYPNPFNPSTIISYSVPQSSFVTIKVYDIIGNEVATLVNGNKQAGNYEVNFDASNLSNGVYMYSIKTDNFTSTKKMILMK